MTCRLKLSAFETKFIRVNDDERKYRDPKNYRPLQYYKTY